MVFTVVVVVVVVVGSLPLALMVVVVVVVMVDVVVGGFVRLISMFDGFRFVIVCHVIMRNHSNFGTMNVFHVSRRWN